jgi:membrane protease YdiL (CAAX protease family)
VGLWINLPLALVVTPRGLALLKERFSRRRGFFLCGSYLVATAFQCAVLVAYRITPSNPVLGHLGVVFILLAYYLWFPLCALGLGYLLFRRKDDDTIIDWRVILFLVILLSLRETEVWIFKFLIEGGVLEGFYQLCILDFNINKYSYYLELSEIWSLLIPGLVLFIYTLSHKTVHLHCHWNFRTIRICLYFAAFFLIRNLILLFNGEGSLESSNWLWNLATTFYAEQLHWSLFEEIFFRGIIQTYLSLRLRYIPWGGFIAILVTSLLFGIFHYPFVVTTFGSVTFKGLIFGWAYAKTRNLWVPVALHGLNNILSGSIFIF